MAEPAISEASSPDTDREFDPSAEMLISEYDDEHTLDEEEALSGDSCSNELSDLEKESDMPLDDLLAMYGYGGAGAPPPAHSESQMSSPMADDGSAFTGSDDGSCSRDSSINQSSTVSTPAPVIGEQVEGLVDDMTLDKDEIARDLLKDSDDADQETSANELLDSVDEEMASQTVMLLRSSNSHGSDEESSEDADYEPMDDWKKTINVGSDFQVVVPQGLCKYDEIPAPITGERLLWDPYKVEDGRVETFLDEIHKQQHNSTQGVQAIPEGAHVRDDEQALYLLLQCDHNIDEALRRRKMQPIPTKDPMSLWSEEECRNFENGLRHYGKDFFLIQQNKVRTRTVGELVQFYYLWKKTERHDVFANKAKLKKKKVPTATLR